MAEGTKFSGKGYYEYSTGGEYEGEFVDGRQDGFGTMTFPNHDFYEGDWKNGKMEGYGEYHHYEPSIDRFGAIYKGQFKNGVREGVGRMTYANRNIYEGQWQNNLRTGMGVCWFTNGDCYHGLWQFDNMLRGVYHKANGDKYDGEFKDGKFDGYGKYYWADGRWFEGTFKNGKLWAGIILYPKSRGKISEYKDGVQH